MLVLKENEVCPYGTKCKYNEGGSCQGTNPSRITEFKCSYVNNGVISEDGQVRSSYDQTGNMKPILEN